MKLSVSKQVRYDSGPNMTPLVDVVMVILIFLMLAGSFGAAARFLPSVVPWKDGNPGDRVAIERPKLEVFVSSITDDGFRASLGGGESFTEASALTAALSAKRAAHEASGVGAEGMQVLIAPGLSTRLEHVTAVYEAAMAARWPNVGFRAARR